MVYLIIFLPLFIPSWFLSGEKRKIEHHTLPTVIDTKRKVCQNTLVKILYYPIFIFSVNVHELYKPKADRVILLVIDALRMDFVNNKSMPFVTSILRRENNCILETKVETPTVTLPRIKAMTTGSVPQFIDVLYNFASTEIMEDSFLHRAKDMKKNITFYGDDTWIKLYPNMFLRSEGVTSFFVTDYTEVLFHYYYYY